MSLSFTQEYGEKFCRVNDKILKSSYIIANVKQFTQLFLLGNIWPLVVILNES